MVNPTPWPLHPQERGSVPLVRGAVWVSEPVWTGSKNFAPIGIRFPDRPVRSESLDRPSYRGPTSRRDEDFHKTLNLCQRGWNNVKCRRNSRPDSPTTTGSSIVWFNDYSFEKFFFNYCKNFSIIPCVTVITNIATSTPISCGICPFEILHKKKTFHVCSTHAS